MTRFSYSRADCFRQCPYKYKLRYIDKLQTFPNLDANNALLLGTAMHTGIEQNLDAALKQYFGNFYVQDDLQINESIKFEHLIPYAKEFIRPENTDFEVKIDTPQFIGFIDALERLGGNPKKLVMYDFKYSNAIDRYRQSEQLHLYKYFYEKQNFGEVIEMYFLMIPKIAIRQKKTEDLFQFRKRLLGELEQAEIKLEKIDYDPNKVIDFLSLVQKIEATTEFPKNESKLCNFCDYKKYCLEGVDCEMLPKNERRKVNPASRKKVWLYGLPFSGKTTLADHFPNPIMLNTDGNLNSFTAPEVEIKETMEGRQKISGWENFKAAVDELQGGSEFETVVVDLVEDIYEHCRRYCYVKLGIEHESDNSFKAWDYVRNEFLTTFKKLMTMDYNIVLISHEDDSKDITKKSGDRITSIKPNIPDKIANKLAGMVDIVARVVADEKERTLQFKASDVIFGGGRLRLTENIIPLTYEALEKVYENQQAPDTVSEPKKKQVEEVKPAEEHKVVTKNLISQEEEEEVKPETPVRRTRRKRVAVNE